MICQPTKSSSRRPGFASIGTRTARSSGTTTSSISRSLTPSALSQNTMTTTATLSSTASLPGAAAQQQSIAANQESKSSSESKRTSSETDANAEYERLFHAENLHHAKLVENKKLAQAEWDERKAAEEARIRKAKKTRKKNIELPDEWLDATRDEILVKYEIEELYERSRKWQDDRKDRLYELAEQVKIIPDGEMRRAKTASRWMFNTQTQPNFYARASLLVELEPLQARGLAGEIREGLSEFDAGHQFELWVNCPEWMYDAAVKTISIDESLHVCKRHAINPYVLFPSLNFAPQIAQRIVGY